LTPETRLFVETPQCISRKKGAAVNDAMVSVQNLLRMLASPDGGKPVTLDQVPRIESEDQKTAYATLANQLYDGLDGSPEQRSRSAKGQLASALWQRVTEWDDRADDIASG
jgi:hypothetical protein